MKVLAKKDRTAQGEGNAAFIIQISFLKQKSLAKLMFTRLLDGGDNWNRTSDPLHVKQVL